LALKDVETKELKEAQDQLSHAQKNLAQEEEKKSNDKTKMIRQMADAKIKAEQYKFKQLVDSAVRMSPKAEHSLRKQAKVALRKAKVAAKAYAEQIRKSMRPKTLSGKKITKKMAAACIQNPSGCNLFTLKGQNIAAAAKFAESKARQAKREQLQAKENVAKSMKKLATATKRMNTLSRNAEALDEKETRIRLAKLQLNEARAAAAFHSAAKAHLQTQLAHGKLKVGRTQVDNQLKQFQDAMAQMNLAGNDNEQKKLSVAKTTKKKAFEKAVAAAKSLLSPGS